MTAIHFTAPWSRSLKRSTAIGVLLLSAVELVGLFGRSNNAAWLLLVLIPPLWLLGSLVLGVRGYSLSAGEIAIKRLWFSTHLPLVDLRTVEGHADAMTGVLRLFTSCGLFAYVGVYWSSKLKLFRVYGTDRDRAVVLRFSGKTIVITPHDPQQFIARARMFLKISDFPG